MERFYIKILFLASLRKQRETQGALGLCSGSAQTLQLLDGEEPFKALRAPIWPHCPVSCPPPCSQLAPVPCFLRPEPCSRQSPASCLVPFRSSLPVPFPWRPSLNSLDLTSHVPLPCSCPSAWAGWRRPSPHPDSTGGKRTHFSEGGAAVLETTWDQQYCRGHCWKVVLESVILNELPVHGQPAACRAPPSGDPRGV